MSDTLTLESPNGAAPPGNSAHTRDFTPEQRNSIKTLFPDLTDEELELFLEVSKSRGLNPLNRQIYAIKRKAKKKLPNGQWVDEWKVSIQTGIDGFRSIAERTGKYAGQLGPFWCGEDGHWTDVWLSPKPPIAAKVAVLRKDFQEPLWAVAKWSGFAETDYDGNPKAMWAKMPDLMIAKCAEALAMRKAFPEQLSGLYTDDEMGQANNEAPKAIPPKSPSLTPKPVEPVKVAPPVVANEPEPELFGEPELPVSPEAAVADSQGISIADLEELLDMAASLPNPPADREGVLNLLRPKNAGGKGVPYTQLYTRVLQAVERAKTAQVAVAPEPAVEAAPEALSASEEPFQRVPVAKAGEVKPCCPICGKASTVKTYSKGGFYCNPRGGCSAKFDEPVMRVPAEDAA